MRIKTFALAGSFALVLAGTALAQTPAGGGSTEGNMNNPGSVKSNSEKSMERSGMPATGSTMAPAGTSEGPSTATMGAPGGTGGNGVTGSGAAPSGK